MLENAFPIAAILVGIFNLLMVRSRLNSAAGSDLSQAVVNRFVLASLAVVCLPWLVMGLGKWSGSVQHLVDFLNIWRGNPFVVAFHASVVAMWLAMIVWMNWMGGSEFLDNYPVLVPTQGRSPREMKQTMQAGILLGLIALGALWLWSWRWP